MNRTNLYYLSDEEIKEIIQINKPSSLQDREFKTWSLNMKGKNIY